jgi:hypothetical protein
MDVDMMAFGIMHDGMIRTQIQFGEEELIRLKKEALRRGCSVSAVVRESVRVALADAEYPGRARSVMEVAGKYDSGRGNLAREHDRYLDDGW